jgi:hypothetical protein
MKGLFSVSCAFALCAALASPAAASPVLYVGHDTGVTYLSPLPASDAAHAAWGSAVAGNAEPIQTLTFEDATVGTFTSTTVDGVGLTFTGQGPAAGISNANPSGFSTWNTTAGGSNYVFDETPASVNAGDTVSSMLTFSFANPTDAFGAYITGLGTDATFNYTFDPGTGTVTVNGTGDALGFNVAQFFGFTNFGQPFTTLNMNLSAVTPFAGYVYVIGVDDVSVAAPEPATLSLLGLGLIGVARLRLRRK